MRPMLYLGLILSKKNTIFVKNNLTALRRDTEQDCQLVPEHRLTDRFYAWAKNAERKIYVNGDQAIGQRESL